MNNFISSVLVNALYLLALINPISKVSILSVVSSDSQKEELISIIFKSSFVALAILLTSMYCGDLILRSVFHVELHALRLSGGIVLFWVGFNALRKGIFFEQNTQMRFEDMALVPLACPMIAGPATIAACITLKSEPTSGYYAISLIIAILVNYVIMRMSKPISIFLTRFNILGAMIRITGLITMTMGTQMVLDGIVAWLNISK